MTSMNLGLNLTRNKTSLSPKKSMSVQLFTFWGKGEITLLKGKRHGFQKTFVESGLIRNTRHYSENRPTSRVWKVLPKYGFFPDLGGKNGGVLSMRIQVNLDSSFRPPRFSPYMGPEERRARFTILLQVALHSTGLRARASPVS